MAEKRVEEVEEARREANAGSRYVALQDLVYKGKWYKMGQILTLGEDPHHSALKKLSPKALQGDVVLKHWDPQGEHQAKERLDRIYDGVYIR